MDYSTIFILACIIGGSIFEYNERERRHIIALDALRREGKIPGTPKPPQNKMFKYIIIVLTAILMIGIAIGVIYLQTKIIYGIWFVYFFAFFTELFFTLLLLQIKNDIQEQSHNRERI
jgi:fatty acid desaturase